MASPQKRRPTAAGAHSIGAYDVVADSHIGLIRDCNEDSYAYWAEESHPSTLVAVADGIGGHECGDVASSMCIRKILTDWRKQRVFDITAKAKLSTFLSDSICGANDAIFSLNREYNIQHPMGTTIVAGVFTTDHLLVAHAGDSRCYRLRNGVIKRLTQDHSFVAELIRKNIISPAEARNHPFAHIISRSVGPTPTVELEINIFEHHPRDRYVFCSDGLSTHVEDPEIETILYDATNPYEAVKNLLYASLRGGGEDNITVLCVFA
jgi:protein phosphatase